MPRKWTDEQRQAQAEKIKSQKPWLHTTGPKTEKGKAASSQRRQKRRAFRAAERTAPASPRAK